MYDVMYICVLAYVCGRNFIDKKHNFGKDDSKKGWASSKIFPFTVTQDHAPSGPLVYFLYNFLAGLCLIFVIFEIRLDSP
jgi:hypothetical protein